jgi:hypothetical protein
VEEEDFKDNEEYSHEGNVRCGYVLIFRFGEYISAPITSIEACTWPAFNKSLHEVSCILENYRFALACLLLGSFSSGYIGSMLH